MRSRTSVGFGPMSASGLGSDRSTQHFFDIALLMFRTQSPASAVQGQAARSCLGRRYHRLAYRRRLPVSGRGDRPLCARGGWRVDEVRFGARTGDGCTVEGRLAPSTYSGCRHPLRPSVHYSSDNWHRFNHEHSKTLWPRLHGPHGWAAGASTTRGMSRCASGTTAHRIHAFTWRMLSCQEKRGR